MRRAAGGDVVVKQIPVHRTGKRRVVPVASEGAEGVAAGAFTDHHHIEMVLRLHRQHVPAVFHAGQLRHPRLLVQHLVIIHHHVFDKTEGRVTGIDHLEYPAPGEILHRLEKKDPDAEQQAQGLHFSPAGLLDDPAADRNDPQREDKYRQQIVVPREDSENFRGLFHVGGVQRQQGVEVGRAVSLAKRVVEGRQQRIGADHPFLHARKGAPQKM